MSKRTIKNWSVLLILVVSSILIYRLLTVENNQAGTLNAIPKPKAELINSSYLEEKTKPINVNSTLPQFSETEIETILTTLQPHLFHEDPFIEAKLIFELKSHCRIKTVIQHKCDDVMNRYNKLEGLLSNFEDLQKIPTSSELGKTLKAGAQYDPQQPEVFRNQIRNLLKMLIKSNNAYVLGFESLTYQFIGVDYGEILPFSQWIKNQDQEYNRVVLMFSLLKMASRFESVGPDGSNGIVAQVLCNSHNSVCGLDFAAAFQKLVLPGMQKDVDLMISHLGKFADSGE